MSKEQINDFDIKVSNDKELQALFSELDPKIQENVIYSGFRAGGYTILNQAKSNFQTRSKRKGTNEYSFDSKFKIERLKKSNENFGMKLGIIQDNGGYRLRWVEWGTDDRSYKAKKNVVLKNGIVIRKGQIVNTGKIEATHSFYDAVEAKSEEANEAIEQAIIKAYDRVVKKYSKRK